LGLGEEIKGKFRVKSADK